MKITKTLSIADVRFKASFNSALADRDTDKIYSQYVDCEIPAIDHQARIPVMFEEGKLISETGLKTIFHTDSVWTLSEVDNRYLFSPNMPDIDDKYKWNVICNKGFDDIQIVLTADSIHHRQQSPSAIPVLTYPVDQILLFHYLSSRASLLMHTAGVTIQGKGWLLSGPSGAGKSTISSMLLNKAGVHVINDDRMVARPADDGKWLAHGTPWPGDLQIADNTSMPVSALCFLARGSKMQLSELDPVEALRRLFPVTSIPWYLEDLMTQSLDSCEKLVQDIPTYELSFRPGDPVLEVLDHD